MLDDAHFHRLYVTESYDACIMLTKQEGTDVPYVDAFAVSSKIQGQGTGERLWAKMTESEPALFWKSPSKAVHQQSHRRSNRWYFDKATGSAIEGDWTVFWYSEGDAFTQVYMQRGFYRAIVFQHSLTPFFIFHSYVHVRMNCKS